MTSSSRIFWRARSSSLAPAFRAHLRPGGTLILSGTLRTQEPMVDERHAHAGAEARVAQAEGRLGDAQDGRLKRPIAASRAGRLHSDHVPDL
ncbi:hypothetical protein [Parvibaculum sp.]|uniref:hypothetical protein n=1 Tax=Parvibaculum sp. TaxID=2024848 RepID=UPI003BA9FEEE